MTLQNLKLDKTAHIDKIHCTPEITKRFLDLGFTKSTKITPVLTNPSGNMRAYLIKDTLIAVRNQEASQITLE